jgi:hypothetical protein
VHFKSSTPVLRMPSTTCWRCEAVFSASKDLHPTESIYLGVEEHLTRLADHSTAFKDHLSASISRSKGVRFTGAADPFRSNREPVLQCCATASANGRSTRHSGGSLLIVIACGFTLEFLSVACICFASLGARLTPQPVRISSSFPLRFYSE